MRVRALFAALFGALIAFAGVRAETGSTTGDASRQVLVTFVDRSLNRVPVTGPGGYLGRSGDYQSTTWSRRITRAIARDYGLRLVYEWPIMTLGVHCVVFEVGEGAVPESVLERLARDPRIGSAQRMNEFRVLGTDPYRPLQKSLDLMQIGVTHGDATGRNVRVAVIDTGVDLRHPDLAGQVIRSGDFAPAATTAFEEDIHGTAVAGVIAARTGNAEGIAGVAPGARLEVYRACWPDRPSDTAARCDTLSLARALDTVARTRPQVLNLSLTGPRDGLIGALVRAVLDRGVIIVAAVPEDGGESFIGPFPQVIRARTGLGDAATEEGADFLAPGQDVLTTFPHGTYNFISGNSFAAANVTGIVALLMEGRPRLSATELRPLLRGSTGHAPPASVSGARRGCGSLRPALRQRACGTPVHGQLASTTSDF